MASDPEVTKLFHGAPVMRDSKRSIRYEVNAGDQGARMHVKPDSAPPAEVPLQWAVGSGKHGRTFLTTHAGQHYEARVSWFAKGKTWGWTPGQEVSKSGFNATGRPLSTQEAFDCLLCHSTVVARDGATVLPELTRPTVGCERCHGPGREHIEQARRNEPPTAIVRFDPKDHLSVTELCTQCHRGPADISPEDPRFARFAGTALMRSLCFQRSRRKLGCTSCHSPHQRLNEDQKHYEAVCSSCHTGAQDAWSKCKLGKTAGCVQCHMGTQVTDMPDVPFHNHFIRKK